MLNPLVSVIIPTYNYAHYIKEAINSVLQQTYPIERIEIVVVDDGSTDNTKEVLGDYIERGIVSYLYQKNSGKASATKNAIERATGKYIFNLDADDYFFPDKIAASVEIFEADEEIVHVASPAKFIYQQTKKTVIEKIPKDIIGKPLEGDWLLQRFYKNNILFGGGTTYAVRAETIRKINIPDGVDMYIDEFLIMAVLPFGKSYFIEKPQSAWRVHSSNYSGSASGTDKGKGQRLLNSSSAMLTYLQESKFNEEVLKIYRLQHATRIISFKEGQGKKRMSDIFKYASEVFFSIQPSWNIVRRYHVLNRLLPTSIFLFLKKVMSITGAH